MATNVKILVDLDEWVEKRLKTSEGEWVEDVMSCILYAMENCSPAVWVEGDGGGLKRRFLALLGVACSYVQESGDSFGVFELGIRIGEIGALRSGHNELIDVVKELLK